MSKGQTKGVSIAMGYKGGEQLQASAPNENNIINVSAKIHDVFCKQIVGPDTVLLSIAHG